jgi:hypothetical protein
MRSARGRERSAPADDRRAARAEQQRGNSLSLLNSGVAASFSGIESVSRGLENTMLRGVVKFRAAARRRKLRREGFATTHCPACLKGKDEHELSGCEFCGQKVCADCFGNTKRNGHHSKKLCAMCMIKFIREQYGKDTCKLRLAPAKNGSLKDKLTFVNMQDANCKLHTNDEAVNRARRSHSAALDAIESDVAEAKEGGKKGNRGKLGKGRSGRSGRSASGVGRRSATARGARDPARSSSAQRVADLFRPGRAKRRLQKALAQTTMTKVEHATVIVRAPPTKAHPEGKVRVLCGLHGTPMHHGIRSPPPRHLYTLFHAITRRHTPVLLSFLAR